MLQRTLSGIPGDLLVAAAPRLASPAGAVLLDAADGDGWSVTGLATGALEVRAGRVTWRDARGVRVLGRVEEQLPALFAPRRDPVPGAPFRDGWVGFLGYGMGRFMDRIAVREEAGAGPPDALLLWVDAAACLEHATGELHLSSGGRADPFSEPDPTLAEDRLAELAARLAEVGPGDAPPDPVDRGFDGSSAAPLPDEDRYRAAVEAGRRHVGRGDVFQVNLAQRFELGELPRPWALYRHLRAENPAPYAGYLEAGLLALLSCSPELLVETRGRRAVTCPIAGTFPRGATPAEDAARLADLRAHPKEQAEHVMLVDLERNDLGRVAEYGSVVVEELLGTRSYTTVHHLVSTVAARLRDDVAPWEVLRAVFPGGTITGAPKIRATEIIADLEDTARGPYTGALGFVDAGGDQTWNILIRTLVGWEGRASVHAGAGIVWDSQPAREFRESVQKVRRFLDLFGVEVAGRDLAGGEVATAPRTGAGTRPGSA